MRLLCSEDKLLFTIDLVKDMIDKAFHWTDVDDMLDQMTDIICTCWGIENEHFIWFGNLLNNHLEGIVTHATLPYSSAKIEGTNRKIDNIKDQVYGYHVDEYFFLKVMESSRHPYEKNPKSHKVLQGGKRFWPCGKKETFPPVKRADALAYRTASFLIGHGKQTHNA